MRKLIFLTTSCALLAMSASAQTITGSITGAIKDSSGASAPNVKVTATDISKNQKYDTTSNAVGLYTFPFLPASNYSIEVEAPGFRRSSVGWPDTLPMRMPPSLCPHPARWS